MAITIPQVNAFHDSRTKLGEGYRSFSHIPADIFLRIVDHGMSLESQHGRPKDSSLNSRDFPWVVGQVCHSWREIVTRHPQLWTNVVVSKACSTSDRYLNEKFRAMMYRLFCQLLWSGDQPLHIDLDLQDISSYHARALIQLLLTHCHRWKWLIICDQGGSVLCDHVAQLFPGNLCMPLLEAVVLDCVGSVNTTFLDLSVLAAAPQLYHINFCRALPIPSCPFPWERLEFVTLNSVDIFGLMQVLPQLSQTVELTLSSSTSGPATLCDLESIEEPIELPDLQQLTLDIDPRTAIHVMDMLVAVNLSELTLQRFDRRCVDPLVYFMERSQCSITRFTCNITAPFVDSQQLGFLSSMPTLEVLEITAGDNNFLNDLVDVLDHRNSPVDTDQFAICPSLRMFAYTAFPNHSPPTPLNFQRFIRWVEARWDVTPEIGTKDSLQAVHLYNTHIQPDDGDHFYKLLDLKNRGLDICLSSDVGSCGQCDRLA